MKNVVKIHYTGFFIFVQIKVLRIMRFRMKDIVKWWNGFLAIIFLVFPANQKQTEDSINEESYETSDINLNRKAKLNADYHDYLDFGDTGSTSVSA